MYEYKAQVLKIVDGDTIEVLVDCGFRITYKTRVRFLKIDTPETYKPKTDFEREAGLKIKEWVKRQLEGKEIVLRTQLDEVDKYGRILGLVYLDGKCLNDEMVALRLTKAAMTDENCAPYLNLIQILNANMS